jgi:hypothetical protein
VTYVAKSTIQCAKPGFNTNLTRRARIVDIIKEPECTFCWLLVLEVLGMYDEILYKQLVELENFGDVVEIRSARDSGEPIDLTISGFADKIEISSPDEASYSQLHPKTADTIGPGWVVHVGTLPKFAPKPFRPSSHIQITGVVHELEDHENAATGHRFVRARVETYESDLDVLFPAGDCPEGLRPGCVVRVRCRTTARLVPTDALSEYERRVSSRPRSGVMYQASEGDFDRLSGVEA